jgi:hypothetical protein
LPIADWYEVVESESPIAQCDLVQRLLIPTIANLTDPVELEGHAWTPDVLAVRTGVVVLNQTCDIVNNTVESFLLARFDEWSAIVSGEEADKGGRQIGKNIRGDLSKDRAHGQLLLAAHQPTGMDYLLIDFRELVVLNRSYVEKHTASLGPRLRIRSPYRERVINAFGSWLGRADFLDDLAAFKDWAPKPA